MECQLLECEVRNPRKEMQRGSLNSVHTLLNIWNPLNCILVGLMPSSLELAKEVNRNFSFAHHWKDGV